MQQLIYNSIPCHVNNLYQGPASDARGTARFHLVSSLYYDKIYACVFMESCSVSLSALLRLGLSGCVFGARLQEVSSPAGGAARKAALEPERHLLVK